MKRILLTLTLVAAATPVVQAVREEVAEESSCHRCERHKRVRTCRSCKGTWHPFKHNCNRGYCGSCNV